MGGDRWRPTPETPGDAVGLRAENARLREANERLRLMNENRDGVIADLRARNDELGERAARLERLISRDSGNSPMPPRCDDLPGKKPPVDPGAMPGMPVTCPEARRYVCSFGGYSTRNCKHMGRQSPWTGRQGHGVSAAGKKSPQTGQLPGAVRSAAATHRKLPLFWNAYKRARVTSNRPVNTSSYPGPAPARQHVTACVKTRSGGLPQLDPVALGIGDPAEPADTLHVLRLFSHVRSLGAQLREHRI